MMRTISRAIPLVGFLFAAASHASAQMPPSIKGPIDAAKRQSNRTSNQVRDEQKIGDAKSAAMPAAAAQAASQTAQKRGGVAKEAPPSAVALKSKAPADSANKRGSVSQSGAKGTVTFYREVFSWNAEGRRDPFLSLFATGELRPMMSDLTLVGIIYDETGHNSVAILVDASAGGETYRKKVGDMLGRIKLTKITEKDITLNVDEFGFSRQETLPIDRNPRTGAGARARRPQ